MPYPSRSTCVRSVDNVSLSVREWGLESGPAILFVHGWAHCQLAFLRQYQGRLAQRYRLVSYDLRGHGESDHPDSIGAYDEPSLWGDDLAAVIGALGLDRPVLVGWSFGGRILGQYVHQFGTEDISGLNFVATAAFADPDRPVRGPDACAERLLSPHFEDMIAGMELFVRRCARVPLDAEDFALMLGAAAASSMAARQGSLRWHVDYDETFGSLDVPALVTHGTGDRMNLPHAAEAAVRKIRGARISMFEGSGHMPFWDSPDRFNDELGGFAAECFAGVADGWAAGLKVNSGQEV